MAFNLNSIKQTVLIDDMTRPLLVTDGVASTFPSYVPPAGAGIPPTWADAFSVGGEPLKRWFQFNTGPTVPITSTYVGTYTVANQTDANNLAGVRVVGNIVLTTGDVTVSNFEVVMPVDQNPTSTVYLLQWALGAYNNITIRNARFDGSNKLWCGGIQGGGGSQNILIENVDISRTGSDAIKTHTSSAYRYCFIHDFRPWNVGTDGVFDLDLHPHCDGFQAVRSGNLVEKCWVEVPYQSDNFGSAAVMLSSADLEIINGFTVNSCYLNGGHKPSYVLTATADPANPGPFGYMENLVYTNNRFGRNFRGGGSPFTDTIPNSPNGDLITRSGNIWDDTGLPVPSPTVITRPAQLVYDGTFDQPTKDLINWLNKTTGAGTVSIVGNRIRVTRGGGATGRAVYTMNCEVGKSYTLLYDFIKTAINTNVYVGLGASGTSPNLDVSSRLASGTYSTVFVAPQPKIYLWLVTGTGSDGQYNEFDNISCMLTP